MSNDKVFKGMLIAIGAVLLFSIVAVIAVTALGKSANQSPEEHIKSLTAAAPFGSTKQADFLKADAVWNKQMTQGEQGKGKHLVVYTDLFCPYCAKEATAVRDPQFRQNYLETSKIFYELRVTDTLAMGSERPSANSTRGGEALYCAAKQNKFWEYYERMLEKIKADWYDKGIGGYHGAPEIPIIADSFFIDGAKDAGLNSDQLSACINDGTGLKQLRQATDTALKTNRDAAGKGNGLPAVFVDNKYIVAGGFGEGKYAEIDKLLRSAGV